MKAGEIRKGLDAQEICSIIAACAQHRVAILKFGELEIWTGTPALQQTIPAYPVSESTALTLPKNHDAVLSEKQHKILDEEALRENEAIFREQQIEELKLNDPLAYENMVRNGEIEDVGNEPGDDE